MKNIYFYFSLIIICIMMYIPSISHAAGVIPRDGLRLELLLATGAQDTSGNARPVTSTGVAPTYQTDPVYGIPYAQFSGSGGLRVNTAWSAGTNDDFSVSMWIKQGSGSFTPNKTMITSPENVANIMWRERSDLPLLPTIERTRLATYNAQTIFVNASGANQGTKIRFMVSPDGKCSIKGGSLSWPRSRVQVNATARNPNYAAIVFYDYDYLNEQIVADEGNNMRDSFNCNKIFDNKWHHIVFIKKATNISLMVDGNELLKVAGSFDLSRELLIGYTDYFNREMFSTVTSSGVLSFTGEELRQVISSRYSRSAMAGFRLYNRALSPDEIEALGDEYRYAQSDLIGAGNVVLNMEKYTKPNLTLQIKSIPLNLSKDLVEYQYSTNGTTFSGVTDITDISTSTGSITYRTNIDITDVPDGKVTVTLRVQSGQSYQNIGTISFSKIDNQSIININQPDLANSLEKTITANAPGAQSLSFYIVRSGVVCDSTITAWENYSDLTFGSVNDNNIRVCYRAIYPNIGKTIYKLSNPIQGIVSTTSLPGTNSYSLFQNYQKWRNSYLPNGNDTTAMTLELLNSAKQRSDNYASSGYFSNYTLSSGNPITMTDINGDGLVDFLYHATDPTRRAIVVNNGNYTFKVVYKCAIDTVNGSQIYYGDCADTTR